MNKSREVILTGIRSNEELTLGNYLGAILPMVELQKSKVIGGDFQLSMFIPDLHSFTTPVDHSKLYEASIRNLRYFVAAGLNITNRDTFIYRQSFISAHSELAIILNNFTYFGELSRMTQFKEKNAADKEKQITAGLFDYPVLMAADILLYGAYWVPLGEDQGQHLELARDLGQRLNNKFGKLLDIPYEWKKQVEFANREQAIRIRSLRNPEKKMSKSVADPAGTILMSENPGEAASKVLAATTDSMGKIGFDFSKQPGVSNLLQILALLTVKTQKEVNGQWAGKDSYGELKKAVAEKISEFLENFQAELAKVDEKALLAKLETSEAAMNKVANETLLRVQKAVGLRP